VTPLWRAGGHRLDLSGSGCDGAARGEAAAASRTAGSHAIGIGIV